MPKINLFVLLYYILFTSQLINIGNYSFLSYNFGGIPASMPFLELIKYLRIPILALGLLSIQTKMSKQIGFRPFIINNLDLVLLLLIMYVGLFNSIDIINGLLYTIWHSLSFICVLSFLFLLKKLGSNSEKFLILFKLLFWSNLLVILLLFLNLHTFGRNWTYEMAFTSKAFFPYCLLTIIISIYGIRIFCNKPMIELCSKRGTQFIEMLLVISCVVFCFFSARRTPFFLMIILTFGYIYFAIGRAVWKKTLFFLTLGGAFVYLTPKILNYIEEHKYELSILKKLNDIQKSEIGLAGDASFNERLIIRKMYLKINSRVPLFGTGSYNSTSYSLYFHPKSEVAGFSTHNLFLGVLVEHGFVGLILFILVIFRSLIYLIRNNSLSYSLKYFLFLYFPVLLINWFEYNLIPGQVFYWTSILIILFPRVWIRVK